MLIKHQLNVCLRCQLSLLVLLYDNLDDDDENKKSKVSPMKDGQKQNKDHVPVKEEVEQ